MKHCPSCARDLPRSDFAKRSASPDGLKPSCRACTAAYNREHYNKNRTKIRAKQATYHANHRDERREYLTKWRRDNPDYGKKWRAANPDNERARTAKREALKKGATVEPFTADELYAHWNANGMTSCTYCGGPVEQWDHFIPLAKGGEHSIRNLVPACGPCNLSKRDHDPHEWMSWQLTHAS